MIGFCPYLRHEYSSAAMSATLGLIAGTRIVHFKRCFLHMHHHIHSIIQSGWRSSILSTQQRNKPPQVKVAAIHKRRDTDLRFEQWQRPPLAPYLLPATFSECAWSWHLRFCAAPPEYDDSGGFPQLAGGSTRDDEPPHRPFDTLASPVVTDARNDELAPDKLNPESWLYPSDTDLVKSNVTGAGLDRADSGEGGRGGAAAGCVSYSIV